MNPYWEFERVHDEDGDGKAESPGRCQAHDPDRLDQDPDVVHAQVQLVDHPGGVTEHADEDQGDAPARGQGGAARQVRVVVEGGPGVGPDQGDEAEPTHAGDHQQQAGAAGRGPGQQRRDAEADDHDGGEGPAQQGHGDPDPRPTVVPQPEVPAGEDDEQRGDGLDVEVEQERLVDARVGDDHGERGDADRQGDHPVDPAALEDLGDPQVGHEPARGHGQVLDPEEDHRLGVHHVEQGQRPDDQFEVVPDERDVVEPDGVERVEVTLADQGPRLVVRREVGGEVRPVVEERGEGDHADEPQRANHRTPDPQDEPEPGRPGGSVPVLGHPSGVSVPGRCDPGVGLQRGHPRHRVTTGAVAGCTGGAGAAGAALPGGMGRT